MPHRLRIICRSGSKEDKSTREEDKKKKIESLEDNPIRKKAFENIIHSKFKENFQKFKMMSRGTECALMSGYCTSHDARMIRGVKMKRKSNVSENGVILVISWWIMISQISEPDQWEKRKIL